MRILIERVVRNRGAEIALTLVLLLIVFAALLWSLVLANPFAKQLTEKIAFAFLVAVVVRWVTIGFSEFEQVEQSSRGELYDAIDSATDKIWICQTWLPGHDADTHRIIQSRAGDIRLLFGSFKPGSPMFARIEGRDIPFTEAQVDVKRSVTPAINTRATTRFNFGHHPGWIAIIDTAVFWGPTPVHVDNWANDFLFHRSTIHRKKGAFLENQFHILWGPKHSHTYDEEKEKYNRLLP